MCSNALTEEISIFQWQYWQQHIWENTQVNGWKLRDAKLLQVVLYYVKKNFTNLTLLVGTPLQLWGRLETKSVGLASFLYIVYWESQDTSNSLTLVWITDHSESAWELYQTIDLLHTNHG